MKRKINYIEKNIMDAEKVFIPQNPFKKKWTVHLLSNLEVFDISDFNAISNSIHETCEDKKLYVINYRYHPRNGGAKAVMFEGTKDQFILDCEWESEIDNDSFQSVVTKSYIFNLELYIYGDSLTWGIIVTEADYILIGGDRNFIKIFEAEMGGKERIIRKILSLFKGYGLLERKKKGMYDLLKIYYDPKDLKNFGWDDL